MKGLLAKGMSKNEGNSASGGVHAYQQDGGLQEQEKETLERAEAVAKGGLKAIIVVIHREILPTQPSQVGRRASPFFCLLTSCWYFPVD